MVTDGIQASSYYHQHTAADVCNDNGQCTINAQCINRNCKCKPNYIQAAESANRLVCVLGECSDIVRCSQNNSICIFKTSGTGNECQCTGYYEKIGNNCTSYDSCSTSRSCNGENSVCVNGRCSCTTSPYIYEQRGIGRSLVCRSHRERVSACSSERIFYVFVADTSTSVSATEVLVQKNFLKDFVVDSDEYRLRNNDMVSLVNFGVVSQIEFECNNITDRNIYNNTIDVLGTLGGATNHLAALNDVLTIINNCAEYQANKTYFIPVAIFLTDGVDSVDRNANTRSQKFKSLIKRFQDISVPVYTLAIDNQKWDTSEIRNAAEETGGKYFPFDNFEAVQQLDVTAFVQGIINYTCSGVSACSNERIFYVFVADTSTSVSATEALVQKNFLKDFVVDSDEYRLSNNDMVSLVNFGVVSQIEFECNNITDRNVYNNTIDVLGRLGGATNHLAALNDVLTIINNCSEYQANKTHFIPVVIFLTDGADSVDRNANTRSQNFKSLKNRFQDISVPVYTLAIDIQKWDTSEIRNVAEETGGKYYSFDNFEAVQQLDVAAFVQDIINYTCSG